MKNLSLNNDIGRHCLFPESYIKSQQTQKPKRYFLSIAYSEILNYLSTDPFIKVFKWRVNFCSKSDKAKIFIGVTLFKKFGMSRWQQTKKKQKLDNFKILSKFSTITFFFF